MWNASCFCGLVVGIVCKSGPRPWRISRSFSPSNPRTNEPCSSRLGSLHVDESGLMPRRCSNSFCCIIQRIVRHWKVCNSSAPQKPMLDWIRIWFTESTIYHILYTWTTGQSWWRHGLLFAVKRMKCIGRCLSIVMLWRWDRFRLD